MKKPAIILMILLLSTSVYAATVSHTADQVISGTFPTGLIYGWLILPDISTHYLIFNTTHLQFNETYLNLTIDARDTDTNTWNTSQEMIDAVNNTNMNITINASLVLNPPWLTSYIDTNETTRIEQLIASNTSIDSRIDTLETNDPNDFDEESDLTTLLDDNYADISVVDTNTWNTSVEMINAVNNTALNGTLFFDILWTNLLSIPADISDGDDDTFNTTQQMRDAVNNTEMNITINASLVLNAPWLTSYTDTDTWNTTQQMIDAVNNTNMNITINASLILNPFWLTSYTDTNETTRVEQLIIDNTTMFESNTTQATLITALQTDNTTQAGLIDNKVNIGSSNMIILSLTNITAGTAPSGTYNFTGTVGLNITRMGVWCTYVNASNALITESPCTR